MKVCGRVEVSLHRFLIPALYSGELSDLGLGSFTTGVKSLGNHSTREWVRIDAL